MSNAIESETAWETLHGTHIPPKKYVPPFLQKEEEKKKQVLEAEEPDLYDFELEEEEVQNAKIHQSHTAPAGQSALP